MCLGVPGRVVELDDLIAVVDFWGVRRRVRLDLVDEPVAVGDFVLNHVGFAIRRIPPEDVAVTLELYESLLTQSGSDLMAADVRGEIAAGRDGQQDGGTDGKGRRRA
jgi:hydrogenase expression/formation protein HypC